METATGSMSLTSQPPAPSDGWLRRRHFTISHIFGLEDKKFDTRLSEIG
jgi:hypothetical protein